MSQRPLISIITPMYNEEENVQIYYEHLSAVLRKLPYTFELILVDDGSRDHTVKTIMKLKPTKHIAIKCLRFSRNFGKERAVTAGLHEAQGDAAIILDADLQHPVEKIPQFIEKWRAGADVVIGIRSTHAHDSHLKLWGSKLFYRIINLISETEIVSHATDFRLVNRQVIDAFGRFTERERMTRGLIDWLGFDRDFVYFEANERQFGQATYNYRKLIQLALSSFVAHSLFPLKIAGYLGIIIILISGPLGFFIFVEKYLLNDPMNLRFSGPAILGVMLLFLVGIILMCLGLIALYIANIHNEVINRPLYVVKRINHNTAPEQTS